MRQKSSCLSIFWFALISSGVVSAQICPDTAGSFRPNGTYDINRRLVLSYLPSNVTAQGKFYNVSVGQEPDRVHALGMCIHGARTEDCSKCIQTESERITSNCPNQTEAYSWPGHPTLCLLRYSNHSFLGSLDLEPSSLEFNPRNMSVNSTELDGIWEGLATRMIAKASSGKENYYVAEIEDLPGFEVKIYSLMQCTSDLSPGDCRACLRRSVGDYQTCCHGKRGGSVARPSCFYRWELYPFSGAFENVMSASPPPSPRFNTNTTKKDGFVVWRRRKLYRPMELETDDDDITAPQSLQFDFKTIEDATNQFSLRNRLGQGGFGEVYKGTLPNGTEVAVKRLSKMSGQGAREFKTEVLLVAKLQHRNLVRLLGFCLEGEEKILVYEFVPNKSLDYLLFDTTKQEKLNWTTRYEIIVGIARGILYLHQDSRLTVIHRDLKTSNILLDAAMNPKIADFGTARIVGIDQTPAKTNRIVGTYGYMSPEYAMHGQFSTKSDVYSFGVLVLEIISGKMNSSFYEEDGSVGNLVTHAWRLWRSESPLELVDPVIGENYQGDDVTRCIHIALLCAQENPADRPVLSRIVLMLTSNSITLLVPRQPGFFLQSSRDREAVAAASADRSVPCSVDDASITVLVPR
ncbi:PREDICTED: cysteine-rich receptor-like protein kinase 11 isoform X2 [Tarenaya hassleriana]|uniref:cysteine-rich receptor-like protein kinase 11 isoform X2 n=1 Tax=Tarenaya hassleriana TaxID=28532 RepID=UPI00053C4FBF|nr:PREDICTED: cysteine-rich receptor-like protein kinase 11 isoform X2 [Tarenaya hassleriana]